MARRYRFGNIEIDVEGFRLFKDAHPLPVEPKALNLLIFLVEHRGRLVGRRAIIDAVWGGAFVTDHVLNRSVAQLRKLLEDDPKQPHFVETVPTLGYRFIADVEVAETPDSPPASVIQPLAQPSLPKSGTPAAPGRELAGNVPAARRRFAAGSMIFVVAAACAVGFWSLRKSAAGEAPIRSLAVLPLENLSGDSSQEYVADGMTAQLIASMAQIRALRVISQTTAMQYKNAHKPLPQIAKELNVDAVIEGSVMRSNQQIRIEAQLVDAPDDKQLWASSYDGSLGDVVGLENQVASSVAERIRVQLSSVEKTQLASRRPVDPLASEAFFKGNAIEQINRPDADRKALEYYRQAVTLDPHLALAYVGIARSYNLLGDWGYAVGPEIGPGEAIANADSAVAKALQIDPELGEAYEERAWTVFKFRWDFPTAEAGFRHALELEPGAPSAHDGLAHALLVQGRFDESLREIEAAEDSDPLSLFVSADYCQILQFARQNNRAQEQCDKALRLGPDYNYALFLNAQLSERKGDYAEGHKFWMNLGCNEACLAAFDEIHGRPGVHGAFDAWLMKRAPPPAFFLARAYAGLHRKDLAFEWLEKAYELHSEASAMCYLDVDPDFDPLRSDPRFDAFLQHVGLPPQPRLPGSPILKN